jgi:HEAT repeat protein
MNLPVSRHLTGCQVLSTLDGYLDMTAKSSEFVADLLDPNWRSRFSSAQEFLDQAETDSVVRRLREQRDWERRRRVSESLRDEKPILRDLWAAGIQVESITEFVNGPTPPQAVPILVRHLAEQHVPEVVETLARALIDTPRADALFGALLSQLRVQAQANSREAVASLWLLGVALGRAASKGNGAELLGITGDRRNGPARAGAIEGLARLKVPGWLDAARALLADDDLVVLKAALKTIARSGDAGVAEAVRGLLRHSDKDIRRLASRALSRIEGLGP